MNAEEAYQKYLDEIAKLKRIADKKDFTIEGEAEFQAQRQAASEALDVCLAAAREEVNRHGYR